MRATYGLGETKEMERGRTDLSDRAVGPWIYEKTLLALYVR